MIGVELRPMSRLDGNGEETIYIILAMSETLFHVPFSCPTKWEEMRKLCFCRTITNHLSFLIFCVQIQYKADMVASVTPFPAEIE